MYLFRMRVYFMSNMSGIVKLRILRGGNYVKIFDVVSEAIIKI